jgi:hypothetical protein
VKERRVEIEVGYGLEQWITDGFAGETSRDYIAPQFRNGSYGAGLIAGAGRIIGRSQRAATLSWTGCRARSNGGEPGEASRRRSSSRSSSRSC